MDRAESIIEVTSGPNQKAGVEIVEVLLDGVAQRVALVEPVELTRQNCSADKLSVKERETLILEHLPLVRLIARKMHDRMPPNVDLDDLVSTGVLGLISAIDRFDPSRNVLLRTYAVQKIKGAIVDGLRRLDWAPREQRKHARQIQAAIAVAEQRWQRQPTEQEIATELDVTVERYHQWQVNVRRLNLVRFVSEVSDDFENRDLLSVVSDDPRESPSALVERRELRPALVAAIAGIPDVERTILGLHYSGGLTLREISQILGLDKSRVAQLRSQSILRLRICMAKYWPPNGRYASFVAMLEDELRGSAQSSEIQAKL